MKNRVILTILITFFSFCAANAQYTQQDNASTKRQFRGMIEALQGFRLPIQGGHSIPAGDSLWFVRVNPNDGQVYMWNGLTWGCMTCGGSGIVDSNLFVTITRLIDSLSRVQQTLDDSTAALRLLIASGSADSALFATLYRLDTTRAGLDMRIALKQNQLNGTGFVKVSGTTISYDNSTYTPTGRTITINGIAQDLSANRTWTIPVPDTSNLRADIDANSDSILAHRTAINGKEPIIAPGTTADYWRGDKTWQAFPAIPDVSGLMPYSDTNAIIATKYGVDTAKQNIRDEIDNLPAPPVTSVNGQTGNVVLQFMDTAYVSGDTIYAEKGGNTFVVGVMAGGGSLDTSAVSSIVADSLTNVIRQGGNSFGDTVKIGSNDNQDVKLRRNNTERMVISGTATTLYGDIVVGNGAFDVNSTSATVGYMARFRNSSSAIALQIDNNRNIGMGAAPIANVPLYMENSTGGNMVRIRNTNSTGRSEIGFLNTSGAARGGTGYGNTSAVELLRDKVYLYSETNIPVSLIQNLQERIILTTSGQVRIVPLGGTGTGVVTADDDGELTIERPPASGTYTLKSIDGVIQWVED